MELKNSTVGYDFGIKKNRIFIKKIRIMTTKLTLTVEKSVIEKAKSYARETGRSLSEIIENYLDELTNTNIDKEKVSPKLQKIIGVVKLPKSFDDKKELRASIEKKHNKF